MATDTETELNNAALELARRACERRWPGHDFGRKNSTMLGFRVTLAQADNIKSRAAARGEPVGTYLRWLTDPIDAGDEAKIAELRAIFGLADDASLEEIDLAYQQLRERAPEAPPEDDPLAESALSKADRAACVKLGLSPAEWSARKSAAARRIPNKRPAAAQPTTTALTKTELAECRKRGIDPAAYAARKANAARRSR